MSFKGVLVANRGEIAVRIFRAANDLNLRTVAVFSEDDSASLHTKMADDAYSLNGRGVPAYLDIDEIMKAAESTGCDAIHPGYGFLAENALFAEACAKAGIIFVGPPADALRRVGNKLEARQLATSVGAPVIPGMMATHPDPATFKKEAEKIGYPVLVKAAAGDFDSTGGHGRLSALHSFAYARQTPITLNKRNDTHRIVGRPR